MGINLKLFDIDGCLYHEGRGKGSCENWLIDINKPLLDDIEREFKEKGHKLILAYGTNRQSYNTDIANAYRGGSLALALPLLECYFRKKLNTEVLIEPFLMADIYGKAKCASGFTQGDARPIEERNLNAGDSYKNILRQNAAGKLGAIEHADWIFDHSKISLIYAQAHRVAHLNPNEEIIIDFYDDTDKILGAVGNFFEKYPQMLPKNVTLNLKKYNGQELNQLKSIIGAGSVDSQYDWSVRYLSSKFYHFGSSASEDKNISTAAALQTYHEDDHYRSTGHRLEMSVDIEGYGAFSVDDFMRMRKDEISQLSNHPGLMAATYTTYDRLKEEGLILDCVVPKSSLDAIEPNVTATSATFLESKEVLPEDSVNYPFLFGSIAGLSGVALIIAAIATTLLVSSLPFLSLGLAIAGTSLLLVAGGSFFYDNWKTKNKEEQPGPYMDVGNIGGIVV